MFWRKLFAKKSASANEYTCSTCGSEHEGLPAIGFDAPMFYAILSDTDKMELAECSEDFCVIEHPEQTDRFIRACLDLPIHNTCDVLSYGVWVSLSQTSFESYEKTFRKEASSENYFGRLSNWIASYESSTVGLHMNVVTRGDDQRPLLQPYESEHALVREWVDGITLDEARRRVVLASKA